MTKTRRRTKQEQAVIFVHIPKAAGTTLRKIIERQYKPTAIFTVQESIEEFKKLPEAQRTAIRCLMGHMRFGAHELLPRVSIYITVLRDPLDRVISHYYYVLRSPDNVLHNDVVSKSMSLKDFVCSGMTPELDNGQTRRLSGVGHSIGFGQCSTELLVSAKRNLREQFAVVGLAERFDETLILLKRALGWRVPLYVKENVTRNRPPREEISDDILAVMEKYNKLDIELYRYAQNIFEEQIGEKKPSFERELKAFRLLNTLYSAIYLSSRPVIGNIKALARSYVCR